MRLPKKVSKWFRGIKRRELIGIALACSGFPLYTQGLPLFFSLSMIAIGVYLFLFNSTSELIWEPDEIKEGELYWKWDEVKKKDILTRKGKSG